MGKISKHIIAIFCIINVFVTVGIGIKLYITNNEKIDTDNKLNQVKINISEINEDINTLKDNIKLADNTTTLNIENMEDMQSKISDSEKQLGDLDEIFTNTKSEVEGLMNKIVDLQSKID